MSTATPLPKIACPHCQGTMKSPGLPAGSKVNCPKCGKPFVLGGGPAAVAPTSSAPPSTAPARPQSPPAAPPPAANPRQPAPSVRKPVSAPPPRPPDVLVAEAISAATVTQPAHRPPRQDTLVDPNLLPPPKPKPKPKPTEIAVVCRLCGTRMHAPLSKAGQTIRCPDCHTVNEIKPPAEPPQKKPAGPTLDDVPEFGMSEPVERPKYKPLVEPRGENTVLGKLEGAEHPPGWTPPATGAAAIPETTPQQIEAPAAESPVAARPPAGEQHAPESRGTLEFDPPAHEVDEEITIEAPVERIEIKPELPKTYYQPDAAEEQLHDGRYDKDDMLGGGNVNPKSKDAWKRAPFLYGLFEFLFYVSTLPTWLMLAGVAGIVFTLGTTAIAWAQDSSPARQMLAILLTMAFSVAMGLWIAPFFAACLAIVQETANGANEVENWPEGHIVERFFSALYFAVALFISGFPGLMLSTFLLTGGMSLLLAPLPLVASWIILFPIVLFSMLAENSVTAIFSSRTRESFNIVSEAWLLFYLYSMGLGVFVCTFAVMAVFPFWLVSFVGGAGLVSVSFVYCRVLGRLMWYADQKGVKLSQQRAASAA